MALRCTANRDIKYSDHLFIMHIYIYTTFTRLHMLSPTNDCVPNFFFFFVGTQFQPTALLITVVVTVRLALFPFSVVAAVL